jgi:predicted HicB family RNase H-like nuclease
MKEKKDNAKFMLKLDPEQRKELKLQAVTLNITINELIIYYITNNKKLGDKIEL